MQRLDPNLLQALKQLALSENELKIYLFMWEKQRASVQEIARVCHLNRTTVYQVCERLIECGLLRRESSRFGAAVVLGHPLKLSLFVQERALEAKTTSQQIELLLPQLMARYLNPKKETQVQVFAGIEGIKKMYYDVIVTFKNTPHLPKDSLIGYSNLDRVEANIPHEWADEYRQQKSAAGISGRYLVPMHDDWRAYIQEAYLNFGAKVFPIFRNISQDIFDIDTEIEIYGDKLSFISLDGEEPVAVIIENKVFSHTMRSIFETLWYLTDEHRTCVSK